MFKIPAKKWLSNIWIIQNSGICLYEESLMKTKIEPHLISAFLLSIINLGKELAEEDIQIIKFHNLKILFKKNEFFIVAMAISEQAPKRESEALLELIHDEFERRYKEILKSWSGDESIFADFSSYLESLIKKYSLEVELIRTQVNVKVEKRYGLSNVIKDWETYRKSFKNWEKWFIKDKEKDETLIKLKDGSKVSLFDKISEKMNEYAKKEKEKRNSKFTIKT